MLSLLICVTQELKLVLVSGLSLVFWLRYINLIVVKLNGEVSCYVLLIDVFKTYHFLLFVIKLQLFLLRPLAPQLHFKLLVELTGLVLCFLSWCILTLNELWIKFTCLCYWLKVIFVSLRRVSLCSVLIVIIVGLLGSLSTKTGSNIDTSFFTDLSHDSKIWTFSLSRFLSIHSIDGPFHLLTTLLFILRVLLVRLA